jgi:formate hydrogenlyase subunit 3/multisubunit Na+/H+ antiporter MnhD subunit
MHSRPDRFNNQILTPSREDAKTPKNQQYKDLAPWSPGVLAAKVLSVFFVAALFLFFVVWREVALLDSHIKTRPENLYINPAVLAVVLLVGGVVADAVLAAEFVVQNFPQV